MNGTPPAFDPEPRPAHLHPRVVPWQHALAWYEDAMRLFKRAPGTWVALALVTLVAELALKAVPGVGSLLEQLVTPLVACGLLYASSGGRPRRGTLARHAVRAFRAPPRAIAAIVASALVVFAAEAFAAGGRRRQPARSRARRRELSAGGDGRIYRSASSRRCP